MAPLAPSPEVQAPKPSDAFWSQSGAEAMESVGSRDNGLTDREATSALTRQRLLNRHRHGTASWLRLLAGQFSSPIMMILILATAISMTVGDVLDGTIIFAIILASGLLGFWQEFRANNDVAALLKTVQVTVPVLRGGVPITVPVSEIVPGDIVVLRAGAVIPADCRLVSAENLLVDESSLTGESFPVEKDPSLLLPVGAALIERRNSVFLGTHVVSGTAHAVAMRTGARTQFGAVSTALAKRHVTTAFTRGTTRFGLMLVRLMLALTVFIFLVNWLFGRSLIEALLFSLALAVGLTPQMLPAIVSLSLSTGARRMAKSKVIVKRLDAIEDLGSLTVLCTDKTGTLTVGSAQLDHCYDVDGAENPMVAELAAVNAGLQVGFANPLDAAILLAHSLPADAVLLDELPYDFRRKRLSVLTERGGVPTLVSKGALQGMLNVSEWAVVAGERVPIVGVLPRLMAQYESLSEQGFRVVGVATRAMQAGTTTIAVSDEAGLDFVGMLAFHDPAKAGASDAIEELRRLGVSTRLVTGDNRLVAATIARSVGLDATTVITGIEIDELDDAALSARVPAVQVFAEVEPMHKRRIVLALKRAGETVGFLGDGINDAPALHAADVGISVDTAVDVAKEAAAVVLLDKSLTAIIDGIRLGRETFANTLKYVRVTTSANFGNMLSMAIASIFLPFLPLLPRQILLLNFLSDFPATTIASDRVDQERLAKPGKWDIRGIRNFMILFGALSTVFDLATFAVLLRGFGADDVTFRSAWFIESTLTEIVVLLSLRTARPLFRSRPGKGLLISSIVVAVITIVMPYIPPVAAVLGLDAVKLPIVLSLVGLTLAYLVANELLKKRFMTPRETGLVMPSGEG